uniref:Putative retrovirus-related pol polyprotein n=1 Tax=Moniliophthora roreri TaxID=221103 RepID=A0A0W0EZX5_MONRR
MITVKDEDGNITTTSPPLVSTPINDRRPNHLEYEQWEAVAFNTLWDNIKNPSSMGFSSGGKTSAELWLWINTEYHTISRLTCKSKEEKWWGLRYKDFGGPVTGENGYYKKWKSARKEAEDAEVIVTNGLSIMVFVDSFPATLKWIPATSSLLSENNLRVTAARLQEHYRLIMKDKPNQHPSKVSALHTRIKELEEANAALTAHATSASTSTSKQCKRLRNSDLKCSNTKCGKVGHIIDDCFKEGGGKQSQYPDWWKGKKQVAPPSANAANHYTMTARIVEALTVTKSNPKDGSHILADSGALAHFFYDKSTFRSYSKHSGTAGSSSKRGTQFIIEGVGEIQIKVMYQGVKRTITLWNVFHAPDIASNLLLLGILDVLGYRMVIGGRKMIFQALSGDEMLEAALEEGLYVVTGVPATAVHSAMAAHTLPNDPQYLHWAAAHIMPERLELGVKVLDGMPEIEPGLRERLPMCQDCKEGNTNKQLRPERPDMVTESNFQWFIDLWGPLRVISVGGNLYGLFGVDEFTGRKFFKALKNRQAATVLDKLEPLQ